MLYCTRGECQYISVLPTQSKPEFACNQIEADTAMFYVLSQLDKQGNTQPVIIDSEDADVVVLCAHVAHKISTLLGIKRKKSMFDCKQLSSQAMSEIIVRLQVMTGRAAK